MWSCIIVCRFEPPCPSPPCTLHTIEQQLVMQLCDKQTLLALARCSRHCLAAASCDFAFRFLSPLRVYPRPNLGALISSSLLRFCDISLCSSPGTFDVVVHSATPESIRSVPRLREIHCPCSLWSLLKHENTHGVTTIAVDACSTELRLIAQHLPLLRCLHLTNQSHWVELVAALPKLLSLRDLYLARCELRHLVTLGRSSLANRLEHLTLDQGAVRDFIKHRRTTALNPDLLAPFIALQKLILIEHCLAPLLLDAAMAHIASLEVAVVRQRPLSAPAPTASSNLHECSKAGRRCNSLVPHSTRDHARQAH